MTMLKVADAQVFLQRIDMGWETAIVGDQVSWDNATNHEWKFGSGWKLVVFNDGGSWDYIDRIEDADGESIEYEALSAIECHCEGDDKDWALDCLNWKPKTPNALKALRLERVP